ncbi:MAG: ATP-binding protein [Nitrospira sp.]|nr:ATP-binding protein [Nitrospira sp.]
MAITKQTKDILSILKHGIEEMSSMNEELQVVNYVLKMAEGKNKAESDESHRTCMSLLSQYASSVIGNIKLKEEIKRVTSYYNELILQKEMAEKLASLGTIAAGLAHEIKNPLVSIKTLIQLLPEKFDDPEFRDHFTNIAINEVERISNIVSDLLEFAKSSEPRFAPLDIGSFIDYIISMLSYQFANKKISVKKRLSENFSLISADGSQLKQLLLNLLINSMDAMPEGGEIVIEAMRGENIIDGEKVVLKITDTGSGIPEVDKEHLFEPFFTTKDSGTGLGLSICKSIMEKHQGKIHIESVYNKGTTVTLVFPVRFPSSPQIPLIT